MALKRPRSLQRFLDHFSSKDWGQKYNQVPTDETPSFGRQHLSRIKARCLWLVENVFLSNINATRCIQDKCCHLQAGWSLILVQGQQLQHSSKASGAKTHEVVGLILAGCWTYSFLAFSSFERDQQCVLSQVPKGFETLLITSQRSLVGGETSFTRRTRFETSFYWLWHIYKL